MIRASLRVGSRIRDEHGDTVWTVTDAADGVVRLVLALPAGQLAEGIPDERRAVSL